VKIHGEGTEERIYGERTELLQHVLRTLDHELGRPPIETEASALTSYNKKIRRRAGIPYQPLAHQGHGLIEPEREEELVEMIFEEEIDPNILTLNASAHGIDSDSEKKAYQYEVYQVIDKYSKWASREPEDRDESLSIDTEQDLMEAIIELIAERGLNQQQVIRELDVPRSSVDPVTSAMAERGYVEVDGEVGYRITPEGREAYLEGDMVDEIDVDVSLPHESEDEEIVDEFDGSFSSKRTYEVFELLGEGFRLNEIAEEMGENYQVVRYHAGKLKDQGLADETGIFTEKGVKQVIALTDIGEEYHDDLDQIEVDTQIFDQENFSGEFNFKYTGEVFRLLGEGYRTQVNISHELEASRTAVENSVKELKGYGFVEAKEGDGTWLTEEGEDVYEDQYGSQDGEEQPERSLKSLSEIPDMLTEDEGLQIFSLLEDGNTIENIAILSKKSHA
jgi:Mn-dependent DtxR family transcriptional regulator